MKQMLSAAIVGQALIANSSRNAFAMVGDFSESLIKRENLQEYAKSKSIFPAFLFDTLSPFTPSPNPIDNSKSLQENRVSLTRVDGVVNLGGRPLEYDWDGFTMEIIRLANTPDGLPETQSKLVQLMLQWFNDTFGKEPAESSVKSRIS